MKHYQQINPKCLCRATGTALEWKGANSHCSTVPTPGSSAGRGLSPRIWMIPALCESHLHSYSSVGKALNYSSSCAGETGRSHISYLLDKAPLLYSLSILARISASLVESMISSQKHHGTPAHSLWDAHPSRGDGEKYKHSGLTKLDLHRGLKLHY